MDLRDQLDHKVRREQEGREVFKDRQVRQVRQVRMVQSATRAHKVETAETGVMVLRVLQDLWVQRDLSDRRAL